MRTRGVSYTSGVHPVDEVRRIMRVIRRDLFCTSVMLIDSEVETLVEAARIAIDEGLDIVVRPQLPDARASELLGHLQRMARAAEELRTVTPERTVSLLIGTEFSLTARGIVPGPHQMLRLALILRAGRLLRGRIARGLDRLLTDAVSVAREHFAGQLGYGAALWEDVDHAPFDFVGVNLYRIGTDAVSYRRRVRELVASAGKPVVITEFGCGAQTGGDRRGPGSFQVVNWFADPPKIKNGNARDESVQATYLAELIDVYATEGVEGCFAFTFCMADFPHRPDDPAHDLDLAGFGLVAVHPDDASTWRPKEAFHAVATKYGAMA
ncbi:hypothetical protein MU582_00705 [Nocardioidaceae bacterium SCSIO 66511]|nr:hypothetical protein MU582_00705 [Nocardioidaceae bacterium SCSIO 66511]